MTPSDRNQKWITVHSPIEPVDALPPERKVVLVFVEGSSLPYCAYVRYAAGDITCPYFVVYHGNPEKTANVLAWCDCLPTGPEFAVFYNANINGRGAPERGAS